MMRLSQRHAAARAEHARIVRDRDRRSAPIGPARACVLAVKAPAPASVERDHVVAPLVGRMRKPRLRGEAAKRQRLARRAH